MSDEKQSASAAAGALIDSALKLSASVAQVVAEAATGKPQTAHPGDTPLQTIVRHGTTAATGIVSTVASAARTNAPETDAPRSAGAVPSVSAGAVLRVPLSVDNPTTDTMSDLSPILTELVHAGSDDAEGWDVSFDPAVLTVAPQDFEKLVVRVTVPDHAPEGPASASFSLGEGAAPVTIRFTVLPG
ncbi:hypothetical protein [uncultured Roseobacter sp.]|uniref:hypothetical protein n=1 Tax=uncultured Roseobacter sp. TaxID=114847 RepID=UPI00262DD4A3|nr:hypothetical protein [uncultured Roseobacter sp.]